MDKDKETQDKHSITQKLVQGGDRTAGFAW